MTEKITIDPVPRARPRAIFGHRLLDLLVLSLTIMLIILVLWPKVVVLVHSGEAGVIWRTYAGGTDVKRIYGEGIHIVAPWNDFFIYNVRLQEFTQSYETKSSDGMRVDVIASTRFRPKGAPFPWRQSTPNALGQLHKTVGPEYVKTVVLPETGSAIRRVLQHYQIDQIYTDQGILEGQIIVLLRRQLAERYIDLDDLLIHTIRFPEGIQTAIQGKLMEEQASYRYDYILAKEVKEAQRKRIEAAGVRDFQQTISEGLTDEYLRWKSIEAMVQISKSDNSKLVILGGAAGSTPVIVNTGADAATTAGAAGGAPAPATLNTPVGQTVPAIGSTPQPLPPTLPPPPPPP